MHKPILIRKLGLFFPSKICFSHFNADLSFGMRIAVIGNNGSGKSSLLKLIFGSLDPSEGYIKRPYDLNLRYLPQTIEEFTDLSGGQRFNRLLTQILQQNPNCLLLDEPTNHLDRANRRSLFKFLDNYRGTLIIASHDKELLQSSMDTLWHIDKGRVHIFNGQYDRYRHELECQRDALTKNLLKLNAQKKENHKKLMREQERAKKRKIYGEQKYDGDKLALRSAQGRGQLTANKQQKKIADEKRQVLYQLSEIRLSETIKPQFSFKTGELSGKILIAIQAGAIGYVEPIVTEINFCLSGYQRVALLGDNGSGKSTFIKAILYPDFRKSGEWKTPRMDDIGYLDQQYSTLSPEHTVYETIEHLGLNWHPQEIRRHLNCFLFRKNEEVQLSVAHLSGGEKARLCLAQIAAKTPKLLILDEVTNNLDLETKAHMIQVLQEFPGSILAISHDEDFLKAIQIESCIGIQKGFFISDNFLEKDYD